MTSAQITSSSRLRPEGPRGGTFSPRQAAYRREKDPPLRSSRYGRDDGSSYSPPALDPTIQPKEETMAVQVPTEEQLREVAADVGLALTNADVKSFIELMRPSVAAYNVVDAMPEDRKSVV